MMMEKEFDFNSVGKRLPYAESDDFLNKITPQLLDKAHKQRNNRVLRRVIGVAASIVILCTLSLLYFDEKQNEYTVDELITQMSDSELDALMVINGSDLLLNDEL